MATNPASPSSLGATDARGGGPPAADVAVTSTIQSGGHRRRRERRVHEFDDREVDHPIEQWRMVPGFEPADGLSELRQSDRRHGPGMVGSPSIRDRANYQVFMYTACNFPNYGNISLLTMPADDADRATTVPCPMAVQFDAGGKNYLLRMNSDQDAGTDDVNITRLVGGTTWQIRPSETGVSNIARLSYQGKGNTGLVKQGDYYMSFSIDVTNP